MKKLDLKKQYEAFYKAAPGKISTVIVPAMNYIAIEGKGDPNNSSDFQEAIEALYSLSYTLKFMVKKGGMEIDYGVMPLEGQWFMADNSEFSQMKKEDWLWNIMILQPNFITAEMVLEATQMVAAKKEVPALPLARVTSYEDGLSAQLLHIGPYNQETENILKLHQFIHDQGYQLTGRHREIYLSDMRRTAPEKLKTIIRQPMKKL
jgi:hypothetical protein